MAVPAESSTLGLASPHSFWNSIFNRMTFQFAFYIKISTQSTMEDANTRADPTPKKALFNDSTQEVGRMAFSGLINNSESM